MLFIHETYGWTGYEFARVGSDDIQVIGNNQN